VRKSETVNSSKEMISEKVAPAMSPGRISGSVTCQRCASGGAEDQADSRAVDPWSVAETVRSTYGSVMTTWARISPRAVREPERVQHHEHRDP
jgi:hypothetical protein